MIDGVDGEKEVSARHDIIHEAAGKELTICFIVQAILAENLPGALHYSAVQLAVGENVIDDVSDIVDSGVVDDLDPSGLTIDFDLGDMCTARECAHDWHLGDGIEWMRSLRRASLQNLREGDRAIRPFHDITPIAIFDIVN